MRHGTRGSPSWPGFDPETDTLMQTAQIRSRKLLADGAGHTFRPRRSDELLRRRKLRRRRKQTADPLSKHGPPGCFGHSRAKESNPSPGTDQWLLVPGASLRREWVNWGRYRIQLSSVFVTICPLGEVGEEPFGCIWSGTSAQV